MTTRAEEIAAEGPYTVRYDNGRYVIDGPTPTVGFWALEEWDAQNHADDLNAAYRQGQQDRWIPAPNKNDLWIGEPGNNGSVLTYGPKRGIVQRSKYFGAWPNSVTHYCELPSPPNPEQR